MRTIVLTIFLALLGGGAFAAEATDLILGEFDATNKKIRIEIAVDIKRKIEGVSQFLPTQKPQELLWVEREREEIGKLTGPAMQSRMTQFFESVEFQQQRLSVMLDLLSDDLACITDAKSSTAREMFCWNSTGVHLSDKSRFDDAIAILLKAGRLPPEVKKGVLGPESLGYWFWFATYGRGIHEYILTPYLRQQAR